MIDETQSTARNPWRSRGAAAALVAGGLLAGGVLASTLAATAASTSPSATPSASSTAAAPDATRDESKSQRPDEKLLTGTTASKVRAAALAKYPGATIQRVETDSDGVYEAHLVTAAGQRVTVEVGKDFAVTGEEAGGHGGPGGANDNDADDAATSGTTGT
jgi:type IV secretory pathway TrbL component